MHNAVTAMGGVSTITWQAPERHAGAHGGFEGTEYVPPLLEIDAEAPPASLLSQASIASHCTRGLRKVVVHRTLFGPAPGDAAAAWFRVLRDLASCAVQVDWRCSLDCVIALEALSHLPPPATGSPHPGGEKTARFGSFYWRSGPGFVSVRDSRRSGVRLFVLDDPASRDTFVKAVDSVAADSIDACTRQPLEDEGLVINIGGWLTAVPYRMRHWPVPFRAI
jgi:hypothetical protein